ncbi:MAG: hypothetical protein QNJ70_22230 [Xenococcaceae cyanobacterium MO_207.B15]|nr:hypothetical protein [Xenococcaceae cyanobacterium MO_207.B15]
MPNPTSETEGLRDFGFYRSKIQAIVFKILLLSLAQVYEIGISSRKTVDRCHILDQEDLGLKLNSYLQALC